MTSLAQQLKRLAVPQTSNIVQDFRRPSLLFDTKEAVSIDRDSIFSLGLNGLEELELLDDCFTQFHISLFSETSKKLERSVHSKEANENLNKEIKKFLLLLSPYLLLRPAHKALEWLIHRYHIEAYNVDELLACIIPYHDTNIFVRIVQLFDLKSPSHRWHWLRPIQKPGVPVAKSTLLTHCYKDLSLLRFICDIVTDSIKVQNQITSSSCRTVISFYLTSTIGSLEAADRVKEETISLLIPYLIAGLRSNLNDYIAATYMIVCQLARKTQMNPQFLEDLIYQLVSNLKPDLMKEGISCVCVIYQMQNIKLVPAKCLSKLHIFQEEFTDSLVNISEQFSVDSFLEAYCKALASELFLSWKDGKNCYARRNVLCSIIQQVSMNQAGVVSFIRFFIGEYVQSIKELEVKEKKKIRKHVTTILNQTERRYPDYFDLAIKKFNHLSVVSKLLLKINVNPVLNIHHSNVTIRKQATHQLTEVIRKKEFDDKTSISELILARLNDDEFEIVLTVLSLQEVLLCVLDEKVLIEQLSNLVFRKQFIDKNWNDVTYLAVKLLFYLTDVVSSTILLSKIIISLIPFMYNMSTKDHRYMLLFTSTISDKSPLRNMLTKEVIDLFVSSHFDSSELASLNLKIIRSLKDWCKDAEFSLKEQILLQFDSTSRTNKDSSGRVSILNFMALNLVPNLVCSSVDKNTIKLSNIAAQYLKHASKLKITNNNLSYEDVFLSAKPKSHTKYLPYECFCYCLAEILQNLKVPKDLNDKIWWSASNCSDESSEEYLHVLSSLFDIITSFSSRKEFSDVFKKFIFDKLKGHLHENSNIIKYLSMIWCQISSATDESLVNSSETTVQYALSLFTSNFVDDESDQDILLSSSCAVPSLLILLKNSSESLRKMGLDCLSEISKIKGISKTLYSSLVLYLVQHHEELINDESCLPQMIQNYFEANLSASPTRRLKSKKNAIHNLLELISDPAVGADVKSVLLDCMSEINSQIILSATQSYLDSLLKKFASSATLSSYEYSVAIKLLKYGFKPESALLFVSDSCSEYLTFKQAMRISHSPVRTNSLQEVVLDLITKEFFKAIPNDEVHQNLFSELLDLYVESESSDLAYMISHCLKKLPLDSTLIINEIINFIGGNDQLKKFSEAKKAKRSVSACTNLKNANVSFDQNQEKRLIIILETLQNKKKITNIVKVV